METGTIAVELKERVQDHAVRPASHGPTLVPRAWKRKTGSAESMIESFYHAFHGIWIGLKEERNVRIHLVSAVAASVMALVLGVDAAGCTALALAIGLVLTAEFLNTALEHLVDVASNGEYHESARYAKDTAAAAVLCASFAAAVVGAVVFLPRLARFLH